MRYSKYFYHITNQDQAAIPRIFIFTAPFNKETFDFGSEVFWSQIADLSERYSKDPQIRKMNGNRGSKHFLYMNRTFFGLYNLLHDLKAKVQVNNFRQYLD